MVNAGFVASTLKHALLASAKGPNESILIITQLQRVNEAFEHFKYLRCLIKCRNCIMCYPKVEVPAEPLIQSQLYAVSASTPTPTTIQLQQTEFAPPSSPKSSPVFPTKRKQPRMALSSVWSGPNFKIACEIRKYSKSMVRSRKDVTDSSKLYDTCTICGLMFDIRNVKRINSCQHLKSTKKQKRNGGFKQFAQICVIGDASGVSYYNVGFQKIGKRRSCSGRLARIIMAGDPKSEIWLTFALTKADVAQALTLCFSLKRVLTFRKIGVIVPKKLSTPLIMALHQSFDYLFYLEGGRNTVELKEADFVTLFPLTLKAFEMCVFLSPKMLAVNNSDKIFDECRNLSFSGFLLMETAGLDMFVMRPSLKVFENLTKGLLETSGMGTYNYLEA
ncbi:unnamed protein product [Orchesella dallaii]|uniref:Uncharacterized protein n=1 Tax=Orchesella dallaii TaxID=48710 RepID=A0ABP1S4I1_9HEXA